MGKHWQETIVAIIVALVLTSGAISQEKEKPRHEFTIDFVLQHTPVKDQASTGTCWSFGSTAFFEAELLRLNRGEFDLSEMFVVKYVYSKKATNYVRYHGNATFGQGSLPFDWIAVVEEHGIVPESVYNGQNIGESEHNHNEMYQVLSGMLKGVIRGKKLTPRWKEAFDAVVTVYMGEIPEHFEYEGRKYTPKTFFDEVLRLNLSDYVELTSFTHHPFYTQFILEVPDNWAHHAHYYNIPIADLERVIVHALTHGYTISWDGDVSEATFYNKQGYAVIPVEDQKLEEGQPEVEKEISQEMRQETFDNYTTSDDHLMHIVGIARDQKNTKFYYTKNSWGKETGLDGYWYLSHSFVMLKTIAIMVHKDAIPQDIRVRLNIR